MSVNAIAVCDRTLVERLLRSINHSDVTINTIYTNIVRPGGYVYNGRRIAAIPACDIDQADRADGDFCIAVRHIHDADVEMRLAARGFDASRFLDLDAISMFHDAPGLVSALRLIRTGAFRWRGLATGLSYFRAGLIDEVFDYEVANLAGDSQDLHYDLALVEAALRDGSHGLQYAVLGLAPYSFQYDLSLGGEHWRFIKYYAALGDHRGLGADLPISLDQVFSPAFHATEAAKVDTVTQNTFSSLFTTSRVEHFSMRAMFEARSKAAKWATRRYPATEAANSEIFARMVDVCLSAGLKVMIVLPPASPLFRDAIGAERMAELHARIGLELQKPGVHFGDFYSTNQDDETSFYDSDHLNTKGARHFSVRLRTWIEGVLALG